ncbi:NAD(P)-binding protein [Colletotrichum zoysiae]|uniref:NAD(P)-binding protein n=1 Tax=Colletotrichum zoysiae TaxID=1216348 RepID=A0AAD9H2R6_9PEZI|nr:NAD(P)-binding protein [Colletotrichum zoysiae]
MPGLLDTLAFDDDQSISADDGPIAPELVEIAPRAYGVNFRDVMVAMSWGSSAPPSSPARARVEWTNVAHMPAGLGFEEAASLPVIFCTAYIGLVDLVRLSPGDTVHIHAAAGGVGQAAILMARHLGTDVFVTVGTPEKRQLVMSKYGIPADRVFRVTVTRHTNRDASFDSGVLAANNGRGVDVAIGVAAETAGVLGRLQRTGYMPLSEDQVLGVLQSAILAPYEPQVAVGLNSGPGNHWDHAGASHLGRDAGFSALRAGEVDQIRGKSGPRTAAEVSIFGVMQSASLAALAADVAAKSTHVSANLFAP